MNFENIPCHQRSFMFGLEMFTMTNPIILALNEMLFKTTHVIFLSFNRKEFCLTVIPKKQNKQINKD